MTTQQIKKRLEYLRGEIIDENISQSEIAELQGLADHIDKGDVLLLEWAGVPEVEEDNPFTPEDFNQLSKLLKKLHDYTDMDNMPLLAAIQALVKILNE